MAVLYITEYSQLFQDANGQGAMPRDPPIAEQTIAIGGASAASAAFNAATRFIRVHSDAICSVLVGTAPVATATSGRMAANQTEYRAVLAGSEIAVITNT